MEKEQGKPGENAKTEASKSRQESGMARTRDRSSRMDHGETEQRPRYFTIDGETESTPNGKAG